MHTGPPTVARRVAVATLVVIAVFGHGLAFPDPTGAQVALTGDWRLLSPSMPINPIHAALLRTGQVLVVSGSENDPTVTTYRAAVWDPATGAFAVQDIPWDLFCNAMSFLPDGRLLTTGGNLQYNPFRGIRTTTVFDPITRQFTQVQDMARGRWYPSNVALGNGRTMTFSGWLETGGTNTAVELYTVPGGWSSERAAPFTPPLYPWLHLLPDGHVFEAGAQVSSHLFDPSAQTWTTGVATTAYPRERTYGSSVLLPLRPDEDYRARVMIMGGDNPATASVELIDLSQPTPAWRTLPPMSAPRIQMNAVLLPTGKVLALGGSVQNNTASTASLGADLFDPASETWSPAGTMMRPRMYHSVALLMPDATVWVAGSNPQEGTWDNTMEVYRPAYLFTAGGATAPRPAITSAPARIGYGGSFQVATPNATSIASVALMRPGSSTHAFNFEQRLVNLTFTAAAGTLTLTAPPNANVAPPGYYMLFLVDGAGVPSVAAWVQLTSRPGDEPPHGTITAPAGDVTIRAGASVTFAGSGTDADGSVSTFAWSFLGGTPATSTAATPGAVTFATPGTYDTMLTVGDDLGVTDPSPPRRRITVLPASLTAGFTAPAAGATVAGTQPVAMTVSAASGSANTFTLTIDGTQVFTTTTAATSASFSWSTGSYADGPHTLGLTVRDATGATATTTRAVTVNNTATGNDLGVSFPNLAPGQTLRGLATVRVAAAGTSGASNRFAIQVDGVVVDTVLTNATTIDWSWNTIGLANGSHTIGATVTDATGRAGTGVEYVTVQNSLRVFITSPAAGATLSGTTWVDVWVEGVTGTSNVFTLSVGGTTVASSTSAGRHVTLPWDTTRTPNGPRTLVAQVRDAQNDGGQDTRAVTVQNAGAGLTATFTTPAAGATVSGTVSVGLAASGGTTPYTYRLTIDGAQVFTTTTAGTATHAWDTSTASSGSHTLGLSVTDGAGATATATRTVTVAGATGTLRIFLTTPSPGATVSGTVWVNVWVEGAVAGAKSYTMTVGGTTLWAQSSTDTHVTLPWTTTSTPNGARTLAVSVTDASGNSGGGTVTVTVQNGAPSLTAGLASPAAGATVSGTVTVGLTASGGSAPYTYRLTIDGGPVFTTSSSAGSASYAWNTTSVSDGSHTLALTVTDTAGASASATRTVTVTNATSGALQVALTSPGVGATVSGTVWVNIWVDGAAAGSKAYTMSVGGTTVWSETSANSHVTLPWTTSGTANGARTLAVTVRDSANATGTANVAVTVQNP